MKNRCCLKRNNFYLILLPVLMSLLTIVFITGCGETELECYTQHIVGTWEEPARDSSPYSGDEIRLRGTWLDDEVSLHCR